jgi:hypothetical protein
VPVRLEAVTYVEQRPKVSPFQKVEREKSNKSNIFTESQEDRLPRYAPIEIVEANQTPASQILEIQSKEI